MKQAGAALGYGRYADAISQTAAGQYQVSDPALRNEILALRSDPTANAVMAGAFTKANTSFAERADRPFTERGRTLYRAFSRRRQARRD